VHQFEVLPKPPDTRAENNPWPQWPQIFRISGAHEEGGERLYSVSTTEFVGDGGGRVQSLRGVSVVPAQDNGRMVFRNVPGSDFSLECELVLLAMGFTGPERSVVDQLGVKLTDRGTVWRDEQWMTSVPGVFTAGDMQRGQSLIVWAIAEGRSAARGVDQWLTGHSQLPAPLQ
jgi:glutamate synthase (NADPH/NADH) small chain